MGNLPIMDIKNKCSTLKELRQIDPEGYSNCPLPSMTEELVSHIFKVCEALWLHSGNPADPHAELTSGKCSDGFVDTLRVLRNTNLNAILSYELIAKFEEHYKDRVDWVIGSDHAGATLSYRVAEWMNAQHDFTEKGPDKTQIWKRFTIEPDEVVLQVEELITTTGTLEAVRKGVRDGNPYKVQFAPAVMTLIHRSDIYEFEGNPILYLAHYDIKVWDPKDCPLCAAGSERIKPKQNWAKLTAK